MKITQIGHGTSSDNEHIVFCVVDFNKVVVSSYYPDKQEYGMYWFEEWVQQQINRKTDTITWVDLEWLDSMKGFSAITRVEKPKLSSRYGEITYQGAKVPYRNPLNKQKRNDICSCGSGKKFKNCCY